MLVLSAAAFTVLAGVARADVPYVNALEVARCTRLDPHNLSYPAESRRAGHAGDVTVGGVVAPDGALSDVTVLTSGGHAELDAAVTEAFMAIHCAPHEGAQPIRIKQWVRFSLQPAARIAPSEREA
ncbi:energy transducer TonB [Burkholderia contaminans]|nr:energy transducer TonB [Burkholderia contaminans]